MTLDMWVETMFHVKHRDGVLERHPFPAVACFT
jgi:hypothetical protein